MNAVHERRNRHIGSTTVVVSDDRVVFYHGGPIVCQLPRSCVVPVAQAIESWAVNKPLVDCRVEVPCRNIERVVDWGASVQFPDERMVQFLVVMLRISQVHLAPDERTGWGVWLDAGGTSTPPEPVAVGGVLQLLAWAKYLASMEDPR